MNLTIILHIMDAVIFVSLMYCLFTFFVITLKMIFSYLQKFIEYFSFLVITNNTYDIYLIIINIYLTIIYLNMEYPLQYHPRHINL